MKTRRSFLRSLLVLAVLAWLTGCAYAPPAGGGTIRASSPLITPPQVSGSTHNGVTRAQAVTVVGNHQTPARLRIHASTAGDGIRLAPVLESRHVHWRF